MTDNTPTITEELAAWRVLAEVVSVGISDSAADAAEMLTRCWNESRAGGEA